MMARIARVVAPGLPHHVTQRGNRQQDVFFTDADYRLYLRLLAGHSRKYGLRLLGYCLMPNHVHLIVDPEKENSLAKGVGRTTNDYARWLQVRQQRTGHLWQNRFYSCVLDEAHLWMALRYVELNPVRAGLVERAWDWPWSSARAHLAGEDETGLLDMARWGARYSPAAWREALEQGIAEAAWAERFREATRTGRPLAAAESLETLEKSLGRSLRPQKRGRKPLAEPNPAQMELISESVACHRI